VAGFVCPFIAETKGGDMTVGEERQIRLTAVVIISGAILLIAEGVLVALKLS
jgi:hypothetical protein